MANINWGYYLFTCTSANATSWATYTNNGVTYTVKKTLTAGTKLYCTATVGSVTSGTTLTKVTGTGDATITFSAVSLRAHINWIGYVAGEVVTLSNGNSLDIDETPTVNPWNISASTSWPLCEINISNTSTTTPIVITMNTENSDIFVSNSNTLKVTGNWIQVATGTGLVWQTINFSTVLWGVIDFPSILWVETGDIRHVQLSPWGTSGYFLPFFNCGLGTGTNVTPNFDVAWINILTSCYWDLDHWPVFQYDVSTKIATFWNGWVVGTSNGGAVIPNGARVIYPNIHFTSTVFNVTETSRNLFYAQNGSPITINTCGFSRNFLPVSGLSGMSNAGNVSITNMWATGRWSFTWLTAPTTLNNIAISHNCSQALTTTTNINLTSSSDLFVNNLFSFTKVNSTYAPAIQIVNTSTIKQFDNIWSWQIEQATSGAYAITIDSCSIDWDVPLVANNMYTIWGALYERNSNNIYFKWHTHSDQVSGVNSTTNTMAAVIGNNSQNIATSKIRKFTNWAATRSLIASYDVACSQIAIHDVDYDGLTNCGWMVSFSGKNIYGANLNVRNLRSGWVNASLSPKNNRVSNTYTNVVQSLTTLPSGNYIEWQTMSSTTGYTAYSFFDNEPANPYWSNSSKTAWGLSIWPFPNDKNMSHTTVVSWTDWVDFYRSGSGVFCPWICEIIYTNFYPTRGITSFSGGTWTATSTSFFWAGGNLEFSMRNNDDTSAWGTWYDATVTANWQTALSAVSWYTSNNGFFIRFRVRTTTISTTGRVFNYASITCTPDNTWTPAEVGFVPINVSGVVTGSTLKLYDNTVPATPVRVIAKTMTSSSDILNMPYNFDGLPDPYLIKIRKSGYGEVLSTGVTYQRGTSVPVSQIQYTVIDDVVASAITGVSVNGATKTVTLTGTNSWSDIYQYLQWWSTQIANIDFEIPSVTTDNQNYTSTYSFVNNGTITGTSSIVTTGTYSGSGTYGSNRITASNGVFTNISISGLIANSRVRVNNTTDNIEIYNAVVTGTSVTIPVTWTTNKALDLRATNVNGTTAYLPYQAIGTLTSSGASFTASQALDTVYNSNGIDGSTVTECVADYPNIQIDLNDLDGATTYQRIYAWYQWATHGSQGIIYFFNGITATDVANYKITTSIVDLKLDNVSPTSLPIKISGWYMYRDDGSTIIFSGSKSIQLDPWKTYLANGWLTQVQNDKLMSIYWGGVWSGWLDAIDKKYIKETHEKVNELTNIDISPIQKKLNEIDSHNSLATIEIIDTIKQTEIEICGDIVRKTKEIKEDNVTTRQLIRQKSEKVVKYAEKQLDRQEKIEKMIEDEAEEIESEIERIINEEADMIENEIYNKEADQIESENNSNQSNDGN